MNPKLQNNIIDTQNKTNSKSISAQELGAQLQQNYLKDNCPQQIRPNSKSFSMNSPLNLVTSGTSLTTSGTSLTTSGTSLTTSGTSLTTSDTKNGATNVPLTTTHGTTLTAQTDARFSKKNAIQIITNVGTNPMNVSSSNALNAMAVNGMNGTALNATSSSATAMPIAMNHSNASNASNASNPSNVSNVSNTYATKTNAAAAEQSRYIYNPNHMESYFGYIATHQDAALLLTAQEMRSNIVKPIMRRLLAQERHAIRSGSVYVFTERESGMKRWTDGMRWSKSRVEGQFLCYKRMDYDGPISAPIMAPSASTSTSDMVLEDHFLPIAKKAALSASIFDQNDLDDQDEYSIAKSSITMEKDERLTILWKKCFAIDIDGSVCHVVNYYTKRDVLNGTLTTPQSDSRFQNMEIMAKFLNPENFRLHTRPLNNGPLAPPALSYTSFTPPDPQNVLVGFTVSPGSTPASTSYAPASASNTATASSLGKSSTLARKYISEETPTIIPASHAETLVLKRSRHEKYVTCHKRHDPQLMRINLPNDFQEFIETVCQSFQLPHNPPHIILTKLNKDLVTSETYSRLKTGEILQISQPKRKEIGTLDRAAQVLITLK